MHAYTGSFTAADGLTLFTRTYLPDTPAPAAVIVSHGYAEHSGRYERLAEALVGEGYAVYALDHRGHGQSGGVRASVRVFREYVDDLGRFIDRVRETRPEPPRFLFGHSMGGLVALQLVLEHPEKVEGVAVTGPLLKNAVPVSPLLERVAGLVSGLAPDLPVQELRAEDVARDPAVVEAYKDDPLVYHGKVRARLGLELLRAGPFVVGRAHNIELPVLIQHGAADKIASVSGARALYDALGTDDKTLKLYDGAYHEVLNDYGREQVIGDLIAWLDAKANLWGAYP